ncbi:glycine betaine ABC transporter substrate-binding protein [Marispirochaeta sp.]|uniref:glycine betaine ABC transporter substrate-binding protein n=1 Tax=Marispirochaeta sp. TaxID=2038653 RepID=UPI0029C8D116|nr:glycine betaine ABC transporter substrate-binding protein [Marispirochaeta sp.]
MKRIVLWSLTALTVLAAAFTIAGCTQKEDETVKIVFGDVSWDSVQVHNRIAAFIIQNGLEGSYDIEYLAGDTLPIINGIIQGDIDVDMESWHSNFPEAYKDGIDSGNMIDLGKNMPDAPQGWWMPRYVVEGPDAPAPDLESLEDLPKYAHLFSDPEDPGKGVIYGGVAGWSQMEISEEIFEEYGLGDTFNLTIAGSGSALAAVMVGAYQKKEPVLAYYWAPTAVLGKLDMVRIKGSEYDAALVNILVNKSMLEKAPKVVDFLRNYSTSVADNNEFLARMDDADWDHQETAIWFLKEKEEIWTSWVNEEVARRVKEALASL